MARRMMLQIVFLGPAFALATALLGWWGVPVLGCLWGVYEKPIHRPSLAASLAAGLGWLLLLAWTAFSGPVLLLSERAAGVMGVPGATLIALTLLYPMTLAWSAGVLGETSRLYLQPKDAL
jgi:hypothetical protein